MKQTNIELKLLVENIGFKYDKRLSSWLQNILQEKENFARQFVITKRDKNNVSKAKIMEVNTEAKLLVENLCFLYIFKSFFPRAVKGREHDYPTYQDLKSGDFKSYFENKASKLKNNLNIEGERNLDAQSKLNSFFGVLSSVDKLDITKESIRELISKQSQNTIPIPFSPQELSAWNELVTLKSKFEETPDDMELIVQIAEKQLLLNETDQAHELLINVIEINPEKGNAWAILTKIYFDKFIENQKEHIESNARSEFMGEIPRPINSEERWINERIEDSYDQVITIRDKFINAAFNALSHWPKSEPTSNRRSVYYNYYSGGDHIKLIRGWIFFHLTIILKQSDFNGEREKEFLEVLGSFSERYYQKSFPDLKLGMFSPEDHQELPFQVKLTSLLKFLSKQKYEKSLDDFILMFDDDSLQDQPERYLTSVEKNLAVLSNSLISQDFWEYLGAEKYKNTYDCLYQKSLQTKEVVRLNLLGKRVKNNIYSVLLPFVDHHYRRYIIGPSLYKEKKLSAGEITVEFSSCAKKTAGDLVFIMKLNAETNCPVKPKELYASLWWLLILDYMVNKTAASEKTLSRFTPEDVYSFFEEDISHGIQVSNSGCYGLDFLYLLKKNLKTQNSPQFIIDQVLYISEKIEEIEAEIFQASG